MSFLSLARFDCMCPPTNYLHALDTWKINVTHSLVQRLTTTSRTEPRDKFAEFLTDDAHINFSLCTTIIFCFCIRLDFDFFCCSLFWIEAIVIKSKRKYIQKRKHTLEIIICTHTHRTLHTVYAALSQTVAQRNLCNLWLWQNIKQRCIMAANDAETIFTRVHVGTSSMAHSIL